MLTPELLQLQGVMATRREMPLVPGSCGSLCQGKCMAMPV